MFKAIKFILIEHKSNLYRIWQMGISHAKKQTLRTSLGLGWVFIRDMIYFSVFVLFRYLMSGGSEIDGMHFILYLITGKTAWNFINEVLNAGSNAIKSNGAIIKSVKFPITIIPTYEVVAIFYKRLFTLLIPFAVMFFFGDLRTFSPVIFIYYFFSMFIFMVLINFLTSAFVAISEDFNQLYSSITRVIFFSLPILWSFERIEHIGWAKVLLKLNPMVYIITGFRDAYVLGKTPELYYTIYFWGFCLMLFIIGSYTQYKLRRYYSDFI